MSSKNSARGNSWTITNVHWAKPYDHKLLKGHWSYYQYFSFITID